MDPNLESANRLIAQTSGLISLLASTYPEDADLAKAAQDVASAFMVISDRRQAEIKALHNAALLREAAAVTAMTPERERMLR